MLRYCWKTGKSAVQANKRHRKHDTPSRPSDSLFKLLPFPASELAKLFIVLNSLLRTFRWCFLTLLRFSKKLFGSDLDGRTGESERLDRCQNYRNNSQGCFQTHGALFFTREVDLLSILTALLQVSTVVDNYRTSRSCSFATHNATFEGYVEAAAVARAATTAVSVLPCQLSSGRAGGQSRSASMAWAAAWMCLLIFTSNTIVELLRYRLIYTLHTY